MTGARIFSIFLFAVLIALSNASPTLAAGGVCTAPAGNEGDLIYNDDYDIVQYCAGSNIWIKLGGGTVDARIGTLQNSKWCATNASGVIQCDQTAPSAAAAAGTTGQVQFNGGSNAFAADSNLVWDNTNKRLGIGTISPSGKLDISGSGAPVIANIIASDGSMSRLNLNNSNRLWSISNYGTQFSPNGAFAVADETAVATRLVINTTGNVGIGTANPAQKLDVAGNIDIQNDDPYLILYENDQGTDAKRWDMYSGSGVLYLRAVNDAYNAATTVMQATRSGMTLSSVAFPNGNVGIGTASPSYQADIRSNSNSTQLHLSSNNSDDGAYFWGASTGAVIGGNANFNGTSWIAKATAASILATSTGGFQFYANSGLTAGSSYSPAQVMVITSSGNVGIGTSAAITTVTNNAAWSRAVNIANGAGNTTGSMLNLGANPPGTTGYLGGVAFYNATLGAAEKRVASIISQLDGAANSGDLEFYTTNAGSFTTAMVMKPNGNVGIGTTSPGYKLEVVATGTAIHGNNSGGGAYGIMGDAGSGGWGIFCNTGLCGGQQAWTNNSDARMKKDVTALEEQDGLETVLKLRPVRYRWIDSQRDAQNGAQIGFIAQEVEKILPEVVSTSATPTTIKTTDGKATVIDHPKAMSYATLVVPLVKAVQELKAENDNQTAEIRELREEIKELKAAIH